MSKFKFVHLSVHSDYSIVNGLTKITELVKKTASLGMPALAITDFTNLFGLVKFYKNAQYYGIKPIIGADFFISSELEISKLNKLTLLAKNNNGYQNLIHLISSAYKKGYNNTFPTIELSSLVKFKNDLILLSGGRYGDIGRSLLLGKFNIAERYISFYKKHFPESFYLEVVRTNRQDEEKYINIVANIAADKNVPLIATNEVFFMNYEDFDAHKIRVAINSGKISNNYSPNQYLKNEKEMCLLFSDLPEAIENSVEIAKRCNVTIILGKYFLPHFPTGKISTEKFLIKKAKEGLENRLLSIYTSNKIRSLKRIKYDVRLNNELDIINNMGFPGYFLIVMEFIKWAKNNNIPVGPGRGSGAGSLVAYSLNITDINPLKFNLIFERFLNSERISMPDFDIDFCMEKRDQVIDHVTEIYGKKSVSQIITFGTMTAKSVIRDVGRVLGYNYKFVDKIAKLIPTDPGITLKKAFSDELKLQEMYRLNEEVKTLINMASKLEGTIRNVGKHAGGVVIAPTEITDFTPIYCDSNGKNYVTQFDKNDVEYVGLVKFDFLGLRTLTIISNTLQMINKKLFRKNITIELSKISFSDKKSFNLLQNAYTTAIFQLESRGIKNLIKRLQPDCFEDIIALMALFRPGPLQSGMVDNYINRKHGREKVFYPDEKWQHELLKPVLKSTYGIILYQEQVIQIAQVLAGYSLGEADILRRAMGKKDPKEMSKQRNKFELGAKNIGIKGSLAIKIFNLVEKFSGYGFNKSHSTAYALVSYQTLWLKANYPSEFMSSVMTADMDNIEKIVLLIHECWRIGVKVLKPDINQGLYHFYVNKNNEIVYGLGAIKGVGKHTIDSIIESREKKGNFTELFDLCTRPDIKSLNCKILESLIMSGACDCFATNRAYLISMLKDIIKISEQKKKLQISGQPEIFNITQTLNEKIKNYHKNVYQWPTQIQLKKEIEYLGFCFTDHPLNQYIKELQKYIGIVRIKDIKKEKNNKIIKIVGLIIEHRVLKSKVNNKNIEIITISDNFNVIEVILQKHILDKYQKLLVKNTIIVITGTINYENFKCIAKEITNIDQERKKYTNKLIISISKKQLKDGIVDLNKLKEILEPYRKGYIPIYLNYFYKQNEKFILKFGEAWKILPNEDLINELKLLLGIKQVKLEFN